MTENELIVFSAYALGTINLNIVKKRLKLKSENEASSKFNEWLKKMPGFVLIKWNGAHHQEMKEIIDNLE